eukprot:scaffold4932_cov188-Prasinococcus_capsulatus_cf.AAC.1
MARCPRSPPGARPRSHATMAPKCGGPGGPRRRGAEEGILCPMRPFQTRFGPNCGRIWAISAGPPGPFQKGLFFGRARPRPPRPFSDGWRCGRERRPAPALLRAPGTAADGAGPAMAPRAGRPKRAQKSPKPKFWGARARARAPAQRPSCPQRWADDDAHAE